MGLKDLFEQSDNEAPLSSLRGSSENGPSEENDGPIGKVLAGADETSESFVEDSPIDVAMLKKTYERTMKSRERDDPTLSDPTVITIQDLPVGRTNYADDPHFTVPGTEGGYISLDEMESKKQDDYGSAKSLLKELQSSNSVMIDGNIYRIPVGTDLKAILGEPIYPDLETALEANPIECEGDEIASVVFKSKFVRDRYGVELADELAEHGCLLGPDGAVYKLPDDFTPEMIPAYRNPFDLCGQYGNGNIERPAGISDVALWELTQIQLMDDTHIMKYIDSRQPLTTLNKNYPEYDTAPIVAGVVTVLSKPGALNDPDKKSSAEALLDKADSYIPSEKWQSKSFLETLSSFNKVMPTQSPFDVISDVAERVNNRGREMIDIIDDVNGPQPAFRGLEIER